MIKCQSCKKDFHISEHEKQLYEILEAPIPTFCPDCRLKRRLAFNNLMTLHKVKCNFCGKDTFSIYPEDSGYKILCSECYWSDKWSAEDYATDFDESRNLLSSLQIYTNKYLKCLCKLIGNTYKIATI